MLEQDNSQSFRLKESILKESIHIPNMSHFTDWRASTLQQDKGLPKLRRGQRIAAAKRSGACAADRHLPTAPHKWPI
eukprot:m.17177 g.17177  ORF g.17177 m.17177 type:complete len:77 (-) comp5925_c0_seq2:2290-2520(-)